MSSDQISWRVKAGWLHPLHRGVYAVGHREVPWQGRVLAAVKATGPNAVASHFSAAALWGLLDLDEMRYPDVTVPGSGGHRHPCINCHRTSSLDARDRARLQQVPVTTPALTLIDVAASLSAAALRSVVRQALARKRVTLGGIARALTRHRGRRGVARVGQAIAIGPAPARSVLESVVLDLLLGAGLVHPDVNQPLSVGGRLVVPDFRWPTRRLIVEADGRAWHDDPISRERDAERQALLEAAGERVVRITWRQAVTQPERTLARLRAAGAPAEREEVRTTAEQPHARGGGAGA